MTKVRRRIRATAVLWAQFRSLSRLALRQVEDCSHARCLCVCVWVCSFLCVYVDEIKLQIEFRSLSCLALSSGLVVPVPQLSSGLQHFRSTEDA